MNRIPPNLLYLAIYNPTLRPSDSVAEDNEDAEEQAHILFYTSKERAVSRDRMLRQIGLAKALASFAGLFNQNDFCDNVHSQSKRLILVSPEPNFWINATIELAKRQQSPASTKSISNNKTKSKSKEKSKSSKDKDHDLSVAYDYEDGTVHDSALRAHLLQGYERFKLTHGSFVSILSNLGQQALELQLERFFTVWAWSWNLEERSDIVEQLGLPLHPAFLTLTPLLDNYATLFANRIVPVILSTSYIIPSTRYTQAFYPSSIARHLISMIPPPSTAGDGALASSVDTLTALSPASQTHSPGFFAMPAVNMDMRKWNWPGYLTFGRNSSSSTSKSTSPAPSEAERKNVQESRTADEDQEEEESGGQVDDGASLKDNVVVHVDASALEDAISSDGLSISNVSARNQDNGMTNGHSVSPSEAADLDQESAIAVDENIPDSTPSQFHPGAVSSSPKSSITVSPRNADDPTVRPVTPPSPPVFSKTRVYLSPPDKPTETRPQAIHYYIRDGLMLALVGVEHTQAGALLAESEDEDLVIAAEHSITLLDETSSAISDSSLKSLSESLPSANKILQPLDQHVITTGQYLLSSPGFSSNSSHLHDSDELLRDPDITEVFSRGQNPQHWHIIKRGLYPTGHDNSEVVHRSSNRGEVYLEVFRKEASLPDVDNVLASTINKSGLLESGLV